MFHTSYERTALPQWAVVFAVVALSPVPLALPSGSALAAIGLLGSAFVLARWRQHTQPTLVSLPARVANGSECQS
jgi:hypothetical protein